MRDKQIQSGVPPSKWDFSFLEYYRKAVEYETDQKRKLQHSHALRNSEAIRDLWTASIKELKPLIQFDPEPNLKLNEAKVDFYKISVSFSSKG